MFDFFRKKDEDKELIQDLKQNTYAEMQERIRKEKEQQNVINDPHPLYEIPIKDYLEKSIPEIESDANECFSRMDIIYNYIESYINARKDETDPVKVNGYRQHMGECLAMWNKYKRAKMATLAGIDAVIELPFCYSTGSAGDFAMGAISILDKLNSIDYR